MVERLTAAFGFSIGSLLIVSECDKKGQRQTETGEDVQVLQLRDLSRLCGVIVRYERTRSFLGS